MRRRRRYSSISPAREQVLIVHRRSMPPIADLAQPMLRLAGTPRQPENSGPHRSPDGITAGAQRPGGRQGARGRNAARHAPAAAGLLADGRCWRSRRTGRIGWSCGSPTSGRGRPRGVDGAGPQRRDRDERCATGSARASRCSAWRCRARGGRSPAAPAAPTGPNVQETSGKPAPVRTYQDLLETAHDENLFEYYGTAQVVTGRCHEPPRHAGRAARALLAGASLRPTPSSVLVDRIVQAVLAARPVGRLRA